MIGALMLMTLTGWGYWILHCAVRAPHVTPKIKAEPRTSHPAAAGLEDDPVYWPGVRGAWTALDEYQLVRLLKDAAPGHTPTTN